MDDKVSLLCSPISRMIGSEVQKKIKLLCVFNEGRSAILTTVDNNLFAMGLNPNGALGTGRDQPCIEPTKVKGITTGLIDIAVGGSSNPHLIAVTADGAMFGWGYNGHGNTGLNHTTSPVLAPTPIQLNMTGVKITKVSCGRYHTLALSETGQVLSWGSNSNGQLGNNTTTHSYIPIKVSGHLDKCICADIVCGCYSSYALTKEGRVFSWGKNGGGELGIGNTESSLQPQLIKMQGVITSITAGYCYALAVDDRGSVFTWGYNDKGQLGNGTTTNSSVPVQLKDNTSRFVNVAAHHEQFLSAAMTVTGKVFVWGETQFQNLHAPIETKLQSLDEVFCVFGNGTMYRTICIERDASSVSETIKHQFNKAETADVEFVVEGKTIYAHKMLLTLRCDFFKSMFSKGAWKESSERKLVIESFSYAVFHAFIKYLYTDEVDLNPEDAVGLLDLAQQYTEWALKRKVEHLIKESLSIDNVARFYSFAVKYEAKVLESSCVKFAAGHMKAVTTSASFKSLDGDTVKSFVSALSELDVYKS